MSSFRSPRRKNRSRERWGRTRARWVVLGLALLAPAAALPQEGPPISDIVVEGARTIDPERVRALSGLAVGQSLSPRSMQRAVRSLWETDLFNDVALSTRPAGNAGVTVVLSVVEAPVITGVQLEGIDEVDNEDVDKAVGLQRGDRLLEH